MPNPSSFSEKPYNLEFQEIRGLLRRYSQAQILEQCFQYFQLPIGGKRPDMVKQSWVTFLVIKWAYLDKGPWQGRKLEARKMDSILERVRGIVEHTRSPNEYECILFFFRSLAFQQDSYQKPFTVEDLARQLLLFNGIESGIDRESFREKTGLSIELFFDYAFMTCGHALLNEGEPLNVTWFSTLSQQYGAEDTTRFLDAISVPVAEISQRLDPYKKHLGDSREFLELTPFIYFPLIKIESGRAPYYLYLNKNILFRSMGHLPTTC